jgi:hypothetical protein
MDLFLQIWGGGFYLSNKIFFAVAEARAKAAKRRFRLAGWIAYILGVPAWVAILAGKHDWIAASIEAGGLPSMLFGLYHAYRNAEVPNKFLHGFAALSTYGFLALGLGFSLYDRGGLVSLSQFLEIGVTIGFLCGSYLLAKRNSRGWLFFLLMNASMGALMLLREKPILAVQQMVSLGFGIYGFIASAGTLRKSKGARIRKRIAGHSAPRRELLLPPGPESLRQVPGPRQPGHGRGDHFHPGLSRDHPAAHVAAGDALFFGRQFPQHPDPQSEFPESVPFPPSPIVVDGEEEERVHGDVEPEALGKMDGQRHDRQIGFGHARSRQRGPDHEVALPVGEGIGRRIVAFRVGGVRRGRRGFGIGDAHHQMPAFSGPRQQVSEMVVVEHLESSVNDADVFHG